MVQKARMPTVAWGDRLCLTYLCGTAFDRRLFWMLYASKVGMCGWPGSLMGCCLKAGGKDTNRGVLSG